MKIIILGDELKRSHQYEFKLSSLQSAVAGAGFLLLTLLFLMAWSWWQSNKIDEYRNQLSHVSEQLLFDRHELNSFHTYAQTVFSEHAQKAALLEAKIARLEALGGQVADMAGLNDEFDFYSAPAVGGPQAKESMVSDAASVMQALDYMQQKVSAREHELKAIESLLSNRSLTKERYLAGRPVSWGWLSSPFGKRVDPFNGRTAWHNGVDFAGKENSDVLTVGSGVVTWAGERYGYGNLVEISHGNGYVTRYGHNKTFLVGLGDVVRKGQAIAKMGSTGRSTGPHVHFEVYKNGRAVDPARYIYRKTR